MSESKDEMEQIINSLKNIEGILGLLLKEKKNFLLEDAMKVFGKSKKRAEVYHALDGTLTAKEIGKKLRMKRPNVSIEIKILLDGGLIELLGGANSPYRKKPCFELIGLSVHVASVFGVEY